MAPDLHIIYEDADLLVLNKPAGLVCHPTKDGPFSSLISRVRLHLGSAGHLVNRLDRETSGVTVVAKNTVAAGELGKLWESRNVQKEYLAIVHGSMSDDTGVIDLPLGKDEKSFIAIKDCVLPGGAEARTEYFVQTRFHRPEVPPRNPCVPCVPYVPPPSPPHPGGGEVRSEEASLTPAIRHFSLLRILPRTGRKHQIRIHLAAIGHPIVGDKLYGGNEDLYLALVQNRLTPENRAELLLPNHALHAQEIKFVWRGRETAFRAPPNPDFTNFAPKN
jgi:23S rRNA pseudouridine1911/1915/1917 synthase